MSGNSKTSVTKAQAEEHKRILTALLRQEDNRRCADCLARGPTWASVNLGVFICLNCSGIHRCISGRSIKFTFAYATSFDHLGRSVDQIDVSPYV